MVSTTGQSNILITSPLHVVVNQQQKQRLILDLSELNKCLVPPKFKLEDIRVAWPFLEGMTHAVRFDFRGGYHHIAIHENSRKLLGFEWKNQYFMFNALPFGLCSAPWIFTKVFRPLVKKWRSEGFTVFLYIDDGLILGESFEECMRAATAVRGDLNLAGVRLADEKCQWHPSETVDWLGFTIDLGSKEVKVSESRISTAEDRLEEIMRCEAPSIQQRQVVLGTLQSMRVVLGDRVSLRSRAVERTVADSQAATDKLSGGKRVIASEDEKAELAWWRDKLREYNAKCFTDKDIRFDRYIECDASATGIGAVLRDETGKVLSRTSKDFGVGWDSASTAERELIAIQFAMQTWLGLSRGLRVRVLTDSQAAVAILRKGSPKQHLHAIAKGLEEFVELRKIKVRWWWIPRDLNTLADELSREIDYDDWTVNENIFRVCQRRWGQFGLDGFANDDNAKCRRFFSARPCPGSAGVDFFVSLDSYSSPGLIWLVPPPALVPRVLLILEKYKQRAVLGSPDWKSHHLWTAVHKKRYLKALKDVLTFGKGAKIFSPGPGSIRGTAFAREFTNFDFSFRLFDFKE